MGGFSSYYKGEKRKLSKERVAFRAKKKVPVWELPHVEIIGKKKGS